MRKTRLFSILALLLMTATGAWAQTETLLTTITATAKEQASYSTANVATVSFSYTAGGSSAYLANWGWWGYGWSATVTAAEGYTITKCVFYDNDGASATDSTDPFIVETTEEDKKPKVNGAIFGGFTSAGIKKIEVYGYATPTATGYSVTLADGTDDAGNWTIDPATAEKGQTVTIKYNGTKKVKSVKAVKKAPAKVTAITLNKTETSIKVGSTETLSVTAVAPDNATDKTYTWKTSDASKATVDQDGKVTAVAAGTVTIYAEANDGSGVKGSCTVTVTPAAPEYYNKLTKINDRDQMSLLKQLYRGRPAYNSSLTAAQAYALATYQAAIDGKPVYVIMSVQDVGYEIHYALSTDAAATEHKADLLEICDPRNPVRMYYVAQ